MKKINSDLISLEENRPLLSVLLLLLVGSEIKKVPFYRVVYQFMLFFVCVDDAGDFNVQNK